MGCLWQAGTAWLVHVKLFGPHLVIFFSTFLKECVICIVKFTLSPPQLFQQLMKSRNNDI